MNDEQTPKTEWTRSQTLALALQGCTFCYGLGLRPGRAGASTPCNCVFRSIFRVCYARFRYSTSREKHVSAARLDAAGPNRRRVWGMPDEEFIADFCLVSRRTLTEREHRMFRFHFLLGADWKLCCRKLNMERGAFFHEIYRIEQKLGRTFRELVPYALFPVDEYFHSIPRSKEPVTPTVAIEAQPAPLPKYRHGRQRRPLQAPLRFACA